MGTKTPHTGAYRFGSFRSPNGRSPIISVCEPMTATWIAKDYHFFSEWTKYLWQPEHKYRVLSSLNPRAFSKMSYSLLLHLLLIAVCVAAVPAPASQAAAPPAVNSLPSPDRSSSKSSPASTIASAPPEQQTDPAASDFLNNPIFVPDSNVAPEAMNDGLGANVIGPQNVVLDQQNPDFLAPPTTDAGSV